MVSACGPSVVVLVVVVSVLVSNVVVAVRVGVGHLCMDETMSLKSIWVRFSTEAVIWTHLPLQYSCSHRR